MPIANHDKVVETAEALLDRIQKMSSEWSTGKDLRDLADAFRLVVEASPKVSEGTRSVVIR